MSAATAWTRQMVQAVIPTPADRMTPVIGAPAATPLIQGLDLWDMWPLAHPDGATASVDGGTLWFALSAPIMPDPADRHAVARIRLVLEREGIWTDCGDALPDGLAPGSREWSGSALLHDTGHVTLFFTAAGRRGEPRITFEQRLFQTTGKLDLSGATPRITGWSPPHESVRADGEIYVVADQSEGGPGRIKAFRDPAYFRDPADGASYLLFAASLAAAAPYADGAIGLARATDPTLASWELLPPLLHATGVNTELERPHVLLRDGRYVLFWCTQHHIFAAGGPRGPTGLYGMQAQHLTGPYTPLNGDGLVLANPDSEPTQAYSWWVTGEGRVTSFIDYWGMRSRSLATHPELLRTHFGGVPAPFVRLTLAPGRSRLIW